MKNTKVDFELKGIMPLLMHWDDVEQADTLTAWRKDPSNKQISAAGDDRSPAWTWQTYVYNDGSNVVMPSHNLMVALRSAGTQIIMKKQKTFKEASQNGLILTTEFLEFKTGGKQIKVADLNKLRNKPFRDHVDGAQKLGFTLDVRRARVGTSKHIRVRPRFDDWTITGSIMILAKEITHEILDQMFGLAGRGGLCDWRPSCKTPGPYGMFEAKIK